MRYSIFFLAALPLFAGGKFRPAPVESGACQAIAPWGQSYPSGSLICFKTAPQIPYAVFEPVCPDGMPGCYTFTREATAWRVEQTGPAGEPYQTYFVPLSDCVQVVNATCP